MFYDSIDSRIMIIFIMSIIYAVWFYKSAILSEERNPILWATMGFSVFFFISLLSSLGLQLMLTGSLTGEYSSLRLESNIVGAFVLLTAFAVGNGFNFALWRIFLSPSTCTPSLWMSIKHMYKRHNLSMPKKFPLFFTSIFAMVKILGLMLLMGLQPAFYALAEISQDIKPLYYSHVLSIALHTAGLSLFFWKFRHWKTLAAAWAILPALTAFLNHLIASIILPIPSLPIIMQIFVFAVQFAAGFAVAAFVIFCVKRRGAGFTTLVGTYIISRYVTDFLLSLPKLFIAYDSKLFLYEQLMNLLWTIISGFAVYAGFLFQEDNQQK